MENSCASRQEKELFKIQWRKYVAPSAMKNKLKGIQVYRTGAVVGPK